MLTLALKTDNAAFHDDDREPDSDRIPAATMLECARILRDVASLLENGAENGNCRDANGNKVGEWSLY